MSRIYLSPPDVRSGDRDALIRAVDGGWVTPLGPEVDTFEEELVAATGRTHGVALSSGTAALHLSLLLNRVGMGDRVLVSSLTFSATVKVKQVGGVASFVGPTSVAVIEFGSHSGKDSHSTFRPVDDHLGSGHDIVIDDVVA